MTDSSVARRSELTAAPMQPVEGTVDLPVPIDELWPLFARANLWNRWNGCFFWAWNGELRLGDKLVWIFQPIRWFYPYKMFAIANIVELESTGPLRKVTWEVTALPGFFARHTYHAEDLGNGQTRFGSWEKACGPGFEWMRGFWLAHFKFVCNESLAGAQKLWAAPGLSKPPDVQTLRRRGLAKRWLEGSALALVLVALGLAGWFYLSFVRLSARELAPGVYAVLGGGGNTLVVESEGEALLVDTKFPPGSQALRDWVSEHIRAPVKYVVDTHYHYDHTTGNDLYPGATLVAHELVPTLMRANDGPLWAEHSQGVPDVSHAVGTVPLSLHIGEREVVIFHPGVAHTHADLCVYLPKERILATGDLLFAGHYPFFDLKPGGVDLDALISADRQLAADYPDAMVVPGHGPISAARDLTRYADYLQELTRAVREDVSRGETESEAAASIDLSPWSLAILPSFHDSRLSWATASANVRDVYELVKRDRGAEGGSVHAAK